MKEGKYDKSCSRYTKIKTLVIATLAFLILIGIAGAAPTTNVVTHAPTAVTLAASSVTSTSAKLNGVVNPNGLNTTYDFASGNLSSSPSYFPPTPVKKIGKGTSDIAVSYILTGLKPGTTYSYIVRATNSVGSKNGAIVKFTVPKK
jgi:hypothetical protein